MILIESVINFCVRLLFVLHLFLPLTYIKSVILKNNLNQVILFPEGLLGKLVREYFMQKLQDLYETIFLSCFCNLLIGNL